MGAENDGNAGCLVMLVDGDCAMCSLCVRFIAERDSKGVVYFETQQSETGQRLLEKYKQPQDLSTVVVIDHLTDPASPRCFTKSTAILNTVAHLDAPWSALAYATAIPAFIRDAVYDGVAYSRYALFGKTKECALPSTDARRRIRRAVPEF
eukprot:TRINITY_DN276_c0_g1_i5.p1 TRINITY_DN276_c0_g1~~TRINITY_DN276_c0_g1_i5.p1  ORF type:complete len:151 (+),score=55.54 TRINITY_DN276_c0_g1_i5:42-494(+)